MSYTAAHALARELNVSDTLAQILVRRGFADVATAGAFLYPDYRVTDPYLMAGMADARRRIDRALQRDEAIAVHGDYDADGITAAFLMVSLLQQMGADVRSRLPNRFTEGYGLAAATIEELAAAGVRLLITVDCGIGSCAEVALARSLGMDVIITDHHEIEGPLPDCIVVSPKLPGYPCPHLAGVGVAFKLAHALLEEPHNDPVELPLALRGFADVVAIGTVADIVPLVDENRVLVSIGLGRLRSSPRPGVAALMEVAGVRPDGITAGTVGFRLAPRLNAAGRLEDASLALDLLASDDRAAALPLALRLNELNQERQAIEAAMVREAERMVPEPLPPALVLSSPNWHEGVVGIVASRVAERFNRPVILLSEGGDEAKGSGRSIPGFDLLTAVQAGAEHLTAFGGHRAACGLRLLRDRIAAFRDAFVAAAGVLLTDDLLERRQEVDAVVCGDDLTLQLADELELLAPHGIGNRKVSLLLHDARIAAPRLTRDRKHMQYKVHCDGASCSAIHFNFNGLDEVSAPGRFDLPLTLGKNAYNGAVSVQVQIDGLHRLGDPATDLCDTPCALGCERRLRGEVLWRALLDEPQKDGHLGGAASDGGWASAEALAAVGEAGAAVPAASDGRVQDRRGRPIISSLTSLVATGERVLVLVADVARRRPLLSRDVLPPQLERQGLYIQCACAGRLDEALAGPHVVMAGFDLADSHPQLLAAFDHVAFLDPPFTRRLFTDIAAAASGAWLHMLWGRPEVDFSAKVAAAEFDLQLVLRRVWRTLSAGHGRFDAGVEQELLGNKTFLGSVGALTAAFSTLREAGLMCTDGCAYELQHPGVKVDVATTESYRRWHNRYQTNEFLRTCLTASL